MDIFDLPLGWYKYYDNEGREYFYNSVTGATQWHAPNSEPPAATPPAAPAAALTQATAAAPAAAAAAAAAPAQAPRSSVGAAPMQDPFAGPATRMSLSQDPFAGPEKRVSLSQDPFADPAPMTNSVAHSSVLEARRQSIQQPSRSRISVSSMSVPDMLMPAQRASGHVSFMDFDGAGELDAAETPGQRSRSATLDAAGVQPEAYAPHVLQKSETSDVAEESLEARKEIIGAFVSDRRVSLALSNKSFEETPDHRSRASTLDAVVAVTGEARELVETLKPLPKYLKGNTVFVPHPTEMWHESTVVQVTHEGVAVEFEGEIKFFPEEQVLPSNPHSHKEANVDLTDLSYMHEAGVLHHLKERFKEDKIYIYTGPTMLLCLNPYKDLPIYEDTKINEYHGSDPRDRDPHIYGVAETAFQTMMNKKVSVSTVISGESGAGKTESTKLMLRYLAVVSGVSGIGQLERKILESGPVLEAFGNCQTVRNWNSSRFGKFIYVHFDDNGRIVGGHIEKYLHEKSRVCNLLAGERSFHVFYYLTKGASAEEKQRYSLLEPEEYSYLKGGHYSIDGLDDARAFESLKEALALIGLSNEQVARVFETVSAVLLLGNLQITPNGDDVCILEANVLNTVAKLLHVNVDALTTALTTRDIAVMGNVTVKVFEEKEVAETRDALAKAIYARLFDWLLEQVNSVIRPSEGANKAHFIGILDIFGFEIFDQNGFEQVLVNYANERVQEHFNKNMLQLEQEEYKQEQIEWSSQLTEDTKEAVELMEKKPVGILHLIDEECVFPNGSDDSLLQKLHTNYGGGKHPRYVQPRTRKPQFTIKHYAGDVDYTIYGFLERNRDTLYEKLLATLQASSCTMVQNMFAGAASFQSGAGSKKHRYATVCSQFRDQLVALMDVVESTEPIYVRCIKPNSLQESDIFDNSNVMRQLKAFGVMDSLHIRRQGYPVRQKMDEFYDRFRFLLPDDMDGDDMRQNVEGILGNLEGQDEHWKLGVTKVFLREEQLAVLEALREMKIQSAVKQIQALARGERDRKVAKQRRENIAVVQHAARGFVARHHYLKTKKGVVQAQARMRAMLARIRIRQQKEEMDSLIKTMHEMRLIQEGVIDSDDFQLMIDRCFEHQANETLALILDQVSAAPNGERLIADIMKSQAILDFITDRNELATFERTIMSMSEGKGSVSTAQLATALRSYAKHKAQFVIQELMQNIEIKEGNVNVARSAVVRQLVGVISHTGVEALTAEEISVLRAELQTLDCGTGGIAVDVLAAAVSYVRCIEIQEEIDRLKAKFGSDTSKWIAQHILDDSPLLRIALTGSESPNVAYEVLHELRQAINDNEDMVTFFVKKAMALVDLEVSEMQQKYDPSGTGYINIEELVRNKKVAQWFSRRLHKKVDQVRLEKARGAIALLKRDENGMISVSELRPVLAAKAKEAFESRLEELDKHVITDKDGYCKIADLVENHAVQFLFGYDPSTVTEEQKAHIFQELSKLDKRENGTVKLDDLNAHFKKNIGTAVEQLVSQTIEALDPLRTGKVNPDHIMRRQAFVNLVTGNMGRSGVSDSVMRGVMVEFAKCEMASGGETIGYKEFAAFARLCGLNVDAADVMSIVDSENNRIRAEKNKAMYSTRSAGEFVFNPDDVRAALKDDVGADGMVDISDLNKYMRKCGYNIFSPNVKKLLDELDPNMTGRIPTEDLAKHPQMVDWCGNQAAAMKALRGFDKSGKGTVGVEDLETILDLRDIAMYTNHWQNVLKKMDQEGIGSVKLDDILSNPEHMTLARPQGSGREHRSPSAVLGSSGALSALKGLSINVKPQDQSVPKPTINTDPFASDRPQQRNDPLPQIFSSEDIGTPRGSVFSMAGGRTKETANERHMRMVKQAEADISKLTFLDGRVNCDFLEYAKENFQDHKSGIIKKSIPIEKMAKYSTDLIDKSLLKDIAEPEQLIAANIFNLLHSYMHEKSGIAGLIQSVKPFTLMQSILIKGIDVKVLRDEIYCQLLKQMRENLNMKVLFKGWEFLALTLCSFPPSEKLAPIVEYFLTKETASGSEDISRCAAYCMNLFKYSMRYGARKYPPSQLEMSAIQERRPIMFKFYFLDNVTRTMPLHSFTTSLELRVEICTKTQLRDPNHYGLYEMKDDQALDYSLLEDGERICDVISAWANPREEENIMDRFHDIKTIAKKQAKVREEKKKLSQKLAEENKRRADETGELPYKIVFRNKVILKEHEDAAAPWAVHLMFIQAVHDFVCGYYPSSMADAVNLAALQVYIVHGEEGPPPGLLQNNLDNFIPNQWIKMRPLPEWEKTLVDLSVKLHEAQKTMIMPSNVDLKLQYLNYLKRNKIYGSTFFFVRQRDIEDLTSELFLAINKEGVFLLKPGITKEVAFRFPYKEIISWGASPRTFVLVVGDLVKQTKFHFDTKRGKELSAALTAYTKALKDNAGNYTPRPSTASDVPGTPKPLPF